MALGGWGIAAAPVYALGRCTTTSESHAGSILLTLAGCFGGSGGACPTGCVIAEYPSCRSTGGTASFRYTGSRFMGVCQTAFAACVDRGTELDALCMPRAEVIQAPGG